MKKSTAFVISVFCVLSSLAMVACHGKNETSQTSERKRLSYQYSENGCDTGKKEFSTKEAYCASLSDDGANNFCATTLRQQDFERECKTDLKAQPQNVSEEARHSNPSTHLDSDKAPAWSVSGPGSIVGVLKNGLDQFVCGTSKDVMVGDTIERIYGEQKIITFDRKSQKSFFVNSRVAGIKLKTPGENPREESFKLIVKREHSYSNEAYNYYRQQLFLTHPTNTGPEQVAGHSTSVVVRTGMYNDRYFVTCQSR